MTELPEHVSNGMRIMHEHILQVAEILGISYSEACQLHATANMNAFAHDSAKNTAAYQENVERSKQFMERFTAWMDRQDVDRVTE